MNFFPINLAPDRPCYDPTNRYEGMSLHWHPNRNGVRNKYTNAGAGKPTFRKSRHSN